MEGDARSGTVDEESTAANSVSEERSESPEPSGRGLPTLKYSFLV
ncbi:hypothetical protein HBNXHr_0333 [Halorhabdus sp. BNX81]|nr:hypothetical protein HBNXHr_0333 [Halorhabdus sp. BNX81]